MSWLCISFTGHRPSKLPSQYDWNGKGNQLLMEKIKQAVIDQISIKKPEKIIFIFGGALGIDQMAYFVCQKIKDENPSPKIKMVVAVPFKKQDSNWINQDDIKRYQNQLRHADRVIYVDTLFGYKIDDLPEGEYHPAKMQLRNQWMVDHSDLIIAVWDGTKGGTKNCIDYGILKKKEIVYINPKFKETKQ